MFCDSKFNQDISAWDVSNATNMKGMFFESVLTQNLDNWSPKKLENKDTIFDRSGLKKCGNLPYWANINVEFLEQTIEAYQLQKNLRKKLDCVLTKEPIVKI